MLYVDNPHVVRTRSAPCIRRSYKRCPFQHHMTFKRRWLRGRVFHEKHGKQDLFKPYIILKPFVSTLPPLVPFTPCPLQHHMTFNRSWIQGRVFDQKPVNKLCSNRNIILGHVGGIHHLDDKWIWLKIDWQWLNIWWLEFSIIFNQRGDD